MNAAQLDLFAPKIGSPIILPIEPFGPVIQGDVDETIVLPHPRMAWDRATAVLGQPIKAYDLPAYAGEFVNDSDRDQANWAWPMLEVQRLTPPVEARGAQGFWNWGGQHV